MKRILSLVTGYWLLVAGLSAQTVSQKLQKAFAVFEKDTQMTHAISSLYVIDAQAGKVVFDKNSRIGLAPASTQKIITSVTAFELLGRDYRYKTYVGYDIGVKDGELRGNLYVEGSGDPTFGSKRWERTNDSGIFNSILAMLEKNQVKKIVGDIWVNDIGFEINPVPDGWIWQDIGNYYGAGVSGLNWLENQYDLILKPGKVENDITSIIRTEPILFNAAIKNLIRTGKKGRGDNGYIYFTPYNNIGFTAGTVPEGMDTFTISGSIPNPSKQFGNSLAELLTKEKIPFSNKVEFYSESIFEFKPARKMMAVFDSIVSPPLDSINYWFLKKSINMYGEAILKTFSKQLYYAGRTDSSISILKKFWTEKGISDKELNMVDGSGLSPLNRVTTHAQVEILKYAKGRDWFPYFYNSLPEYNGMKIKSGTIRDVKGFCGYHKAKNDKEYIISFLVNNYNGPAGDLVKKMYKVLDVLK